MKFVEYESGEKHGKSNPDKSDTMDAFRDCGMLLEPSDIVVDIDHLPKESIKAMIRDFNIHTMTVWTDRGCHLWFKKPVGYRGSVNGVCRLGFQIERHTKTSNPNGMTVKRNGKARDIDNFGMQETLPAIFKVEQGKKKFEDLLGLEEGDGRNTKLFSHRKRLHECDDWEKILRFINYHIFSQPMSEEELAGILRKDAGNDSELSEQYTIAEEHIKEYKTVNYFGMIWWKNGDQYIADADNARLIQLVYKTCEGKNTPYVDEIVRQIQRRSPIFEIDHVFPIRFRNGVLQNGEFIRMDKYLEFTPYYIDINYRQNAKPVEIVDNYINALTDNEPEYRQLLMEVIGYVLITDPERIRSLGKFFMFRGDGANGKGTLLQIMRKIYNAKNCTNLSIKQLTDDRYKVTMIGKLANLGDDIEAEAIDNDQLKVLKNISTADTVSTRRMYAESETATFTVKLYFTTNSDIRSFEKGYAYKRRIVWLPMFNKVDKPDPSFISKITTPAALEYWVSLIVDGYKRLYHNQEWTESHIVKEYNEKYHDENDVSRQFAVDLDPEEIIGRTVSDMRYAFSEWSSDDRKFSGKLFKAAVWDLYGIGTGVKKVDGKTRKVFMCQADTSQKLEH